MTMFHPNLCKEMTHLSWMTTEFKCLTKKIMISFSIEVKKIMISFFIEVKKIMISFSIEVKKIIMISFPLK